MVSVFVAFSCAKYWASRYCFKLDVFGDLFIDQSKKLDDVYGRELQGDLQFSKDHKVG